MKKSEIRLNVPVRNGIAISLLLAIVHVLGTIFIVYCFTELYRFRLNMFSAMVLGAIFFFICRSIIWKFVGERTLVIDNKYIIIKDKAGANTSFQVFEIYYISNLIVHSNFRYSFWERFKAVWTMDKGGGICFTYLGEEKAIGYGLTPKEMKELIKEAKESQFLKEENFA